MKKVFVIVIISALSTVVLAQSPWVKEKGKGYAQLSYNIITEYNTIYSNIGDPLPIARSVTDKSIQIYGEYGIGSNWQLSAALPYKLLSTGELSTEYTDMVNIAEGNHSALGNIELAIKKNFVNKSFLLSGQMKVELPTNSLDEATGLRTGLDALSIVPSVTVGRGWSEMYGYLSLGSSIRSNDYSGDLRISGEVGTKPVDKLWVVLVLDVVSNFENATPDVNSNQEQTGLYLNNQEYFAYGLKFAYEIKNGWGVNLAGYGGSSGNVVARAPSINIGTYYEW